MDIISNDWWPRFSAEEYANRQARLRAAMAARGLDCLLIYGTSIFFGTDPGCQNMVYLSSYGPGCMGYVVFPREGEPTLIIYVSGHLENAKQITIIEDVRAGTDPSGIASQRVRELGYENGKLGIVGNFAWANASIPVEHYWNFQQQLPNASLEIVTQWYEEVRLLKSAEEIQFMDTGARICDRAHEAVRAMARPGVSDMALHNEALRVTQSLGGRIPFSHVGSTPQRNPSMHYPSFYSLNRVIQPGDVVMTELSAGYGGYFGKIYGTMSIGKPTAQYRLMMELAIDVYHQMYDAIKPGVLAKEIKPAISPRAAEAGYKSLSFITGWGTYNTRPVLFAKRVEETDNTFELRPGLTLNVGGWVLTEDDRAGVWIGDTALVTETGVRSLHNYRVADLDYIILDV